MVANICIITYYCSLIAMTLYYMFASFSTELPWSRCLKSWGTDCVDSMPNKEMLMLFNQPTANNMSRGTSSSELYFLLVISQQYASRPVQTLYHFIFIILLRISEKRLLMNEMIFPMEWVSTYTQSSVANSFFLLINYLFTKVLQIGNWCCVYSDHGW